MKISVIIPFYNEEGNVVPVLQEVFSDLQSSPCDYEVLVFDDGSQDKTAVLLKDLSSQYPALKIFIHSKNKGQGVCFWKGLNESSGDVIITMDGDGQNDFHDIHKMLPYLDQYDAVLGQRIHRKDPFYKLMASSVGYFFRHFVLGDTVRDAGCSLKVLKKSVIPFLLPIRSYHLFISFMLSEAGVPFITVPVNHRSRVWGFSKFSLKRLYFLPYVWALLSLFWFKKRNLLKTYIRSSI